MPHRDQLYGQRWRKARASFLAANPLCVFCERLGRVTAATVVDHKIPHRSDARLFWNRSHWQSLCTPHHSGTKQAQEKSGRTYSRDVGVDGLPVDPCHPWNKG